MRIAITSGRRPVVHAGLPRPGRGFATAVLGAVVLHGAALYTTRAPHSGTRALPGSPAITARVVSVSAAADAKVLQTAADREPAGAAVPSHVDSIAASAGSMPRQAKQQAPEARGRPDIPIPKAAAASAVVTTAHGGRTVAGDGETAGTRPAPAGTPLVGTASGASASAQTPAATAAVPGAMGLPDAPDYLFGARLDPGPQPLEDINPEYPDAAEARSGSVVLRLLIGAAGQVDDVAVVRASPPGLFERSALAAFAAAKFAPGRLLGVPVKSQLTVEVEFTPLNRGARVSGRGY